MASHLSIRTELDNRTFVPGETLRGEVSWAAPSTPEQVELRLFYYTAGKGTRDVEIVSTRRFDGIGARETRDYAFDLPEQGPCSFSGRLVSLIWALELVLDGDGDHAERLEFVLSPTGAPFDLGRYAAEVEAEEKREKERKTL